MDLRTEVVRVPRVHLPRPGRNPTQSRDAKSLNRYFPELLEPLSECAAACSDAFSTAEIVVAKNNGLDFEELQLRIHPAASRGE